jgi:hypothetical protein
MVELKPLSLNNKNFAFCVIFPLEKSKAVQEREVQIMQKITEAISHIFSAKCAIEHESSTVIVTLIVF